MIDKVKGLATGVYNNLRNYWRKPAKGNFVSYKEITSFSVGGMGQQMVILLIGYFGLGAGNTLLGSAIGIRPMHLQLMATVQTFVNIALYFIRGKMVDNTRTKYGRLRPYIALAGIPILLITVTFLFLPFNTMTYTQKLICVFSFAIALGMVAPLFTDTYSEMNSVISPNSGERTNIIAVSSLVYSFAPTIYGFAIPILTKLTGGYTNINTYKYIIAPLAVIGVILNILAVRGYKERVVSSRSYVQKVSTIKGCLEIYRNKYWWIRQIAGIIGFLEGACLAIFAWMFIYGTQNMTALAFATTILGTASGISMACTPYLMRKLGNRKILLWHNTLNVVFVAFMVFAFKSPLLFFVLLYLNTLVNQLQIVYSPALHSEVKDYQQYISGRRMDFTFGAAGQICFPITLACGFLIPYIYESFGLSTNYDILYDPQVRNDLFAMLCILSIIGSVLNLLPYFFYKLSRSKHKMISNVLYYRAGLEDYVNGNLTPQTIKRMVEGVREADAVRAAAVPNLKVAKAAIKAALAMPKLTQDEIIARTNAISAARLKYREEELMVDKKEGLKEIFDVEMAKYDKIVLKTKVEMSRNLLAVPICDSGSFDLQSVVVQNVGECSKTDLNKVNKMKHKFVKSLKRMQHKVKKYYPNGMIENDRSALHTAMALPEETKDEQKAKTKAVRAETKILNIYYKILAPHLEAENLVKQNDARQHFETIIALYDNACAEIDEEDRIYDEKVAKERAEKKAELDELKKERFDKLSPEKQSKILAKREKKAAKRKEKAAKRAEKQRRTK